MGKRGPTKAETILAGARDRVFIAQTQVRAAEVQLTLARASLSTHESVLESLEKALARIPRKATVPKSSAPAAARRSSPKGADKQSTASLETEKANATPAAGCAIANCGKPESDPIHRPSNDDGHIFHATLRKKNKDNGVDLLPDRPEDFVHEANVWRVKT